MVNGDGSLLMNLGSLVTIAANPAPLYVLVMDNQLYEVTGGQATARAGKIDFGGAGPGGGHRADLSVRDAGGVGPGRRGTRAARARC